MGLLGLSVPSTLTRPSTAESSVRRTLDLLGTSWLVQGWSRAVPCAPVVLRSAGLLMEGRAEQAQWSRPAMRHKILNSESGGGEFSG